MNLHNFTSLVPFFLFSSKAAGDAVIIHGIRYKKGSVKILHVAGKYVVELRRYFLFRIPYYVSRKVFRTLEEAENEYGRLQSLLYRLS